MKVFSSFEVWIDPPVASNSTGKSIHHPVRVIDSPAGAAFGFLNLDLKSKKFREALAAVRGEGSDLQVRKDFGGALHQALFSGDVRDAWTTSLGRVEAGQSNGISLKLWINDPGLAVLPWELLWNEKNEFLATAASLALSRYLPVPEPANPPIQGSIEVLIAVASPNKFPAIPEQMILGLEKKINQTQLPIHCQIQRKASRGNIQQALQQGVHILHFLGHGKPGGLALVHEADNEAEFLNDIQFAQLFSGRNDLRLVVLSACASGVSQTDNLFTGVGPTIIQKRIPAVIAMQYPTVQMDSAGQFSEGLYCALANNLPIDMAVNEARQLLSAGPLLGTRDWSNPILYMGTRNGAILDLVSANDGSSLATWDQIKASMQDYSLTAQLTSRVHEISTLQEELKVYQEAEDNLEKVSAQLSRCFQIAEKCKGDPAGLNSNNFQAAWEERGEAELRAIEGFLHNNMEFATEKGIDAIITKTGLVDRYLKQLALKKLLDEINDLRRNLNLAEQVIHQEQRFLIQKLLSLGESTFGQLETG